MTLLKHRDISLLDVAITECAANPGESMESVMKRRQEFMRSNGAESSDYADLEEYYKGLQEKNSLA